MANGMGLERGVVTLPGGARVDYRTGGQEEGRPVVLLHGGGTDSGMLSWRDTIPALVEAGFRIYTPDMPGYGDSPLDQRPSTVQNLIGYLDGLMDAWALDRAALVGVSMGGAVAIGYALSQPTRVDRLVLIGTYGIQDRAPFHRLSYLYVRIPWLTRLSWALMRRSRALTRYSLRQIVRNPGARNEALVDEVLAAMESPGAQRAARPADPAHRHALTRPPVHPRGAAVRPGGRAPDRSGSGRCRARAGAPTPVAALPGAAATPASGRCASRRRARGRW